MKAIFDEEAQKNHVYPLDDRGTGRLITPKPTPSDPNRTNLPTTPGAVRLAETAAPNTKNKSHTITADIVMPESGGEGVIVARVGAPPALPSTCRDGKLVYHYNWFDEDRYHHHIQRTVPAGKSTVRFDFAYDGGGLGKGGNGRALHQRQEGR